jgi:hypothetical protein
MKVLTVTSHLHLFDFRIRLASCPFCRVTYCAKHWSVRFLLCENIINQIVTLEGIWPTILTACHLPFDIAGKEWESEAWEL